MGNYNNFANEYKVLTEELENKTRKNSYTILGNLKNKNMLDVGCGSGCDLKYYIDCGATVSGIDISNKEIEIVKRELTGTFLVADMLTLPFKDNSFHITTSTYAIQAAENVKKVILEMIRVTKSGGDIFILSKHPFRTLLEGYINDDKMNYFEKGDVTSYIFNREIKLTEPSHTLQEYFDTEILSKSNLVLFEEHCDFPASEQIIDGVTYPTYMILKFKKN